MTMDVTRVADEIAAMASLVDGSDPATTVPTCPGWTLADLVGHVGTVHRWAAHHVRVLAPARVPSAELDLGVPLDPTQVGDYLRTGADVLLPALAEADPDAPMWAWGRDQHARFWSRRMLHETAVHHADAAIALGVIPTLNDATDGVDEFLENLPHAVRFAPRVAELTGSGETIVLDGGVTSWTIRLSAEGFTWTHDVAAGPTVTVSGKPDDLLLFVYGRYPADQLAITGDRALLDRWTDRSSI